MSETRSLLVVAPTAWRMARLSVLFAFDISRISRGDGDLLEPMILTAILQANQAAMQNDPELQLRFGETAWALPDELRRPISVNAIAQSLGLPFETVRRRVQAMTARGQCVATPAGVYAPQAAVTSQAYLAVLRRRAERLARLHRELAAAGLQPPNPSLEDFLDTAPRAADRILANYMLRACGGLLELTGNAMDGMALLSLAALNIAELKVTELTDWNDYAELAEPCSATALANALGMPNETVRRHLHRLGEAGFCRRSKKGWIAAAPADRSPLLGRLVTENARDLQRLFAALNDLAGRAGHGLGRQAL